MPLVIKVSFNAFKEVEKRLWYRWWDKGRERSNRAHQMMEAGAVGRRCIMKHDQLAYTGPPDDTVRAYVCLRCHAAACEPEIKDRNYSFDTVPDWIIKDILDTDLGRQAVGRYSPKG